MKSTPRRVLLAMTSAILGVSSSNAGSTVSTAGQSSPGIGAPWDHVVWAEKALKKCLKDSATAMIIFEGTPLTVQTAGKPIEKCEPAILDLAKLRGSVEARQFAKATVKSFIDGAAK